MSLAVSPLLPADRASWEVLARGYKAFYRTATSPAEYEATWKRLLQRDDVFGIGAKVDGKLIGIAHYLFHTSAWAAKICYLQDLFVAPEVRGKGTARALIEAVAAAARQAQATRYYWLTQENNTVARVLYDKVGKYNGFIRYDFPLQE
jgi:GNAT superfamily N-acetyltransferase